MSRLELTRENITSNNALVRLSFTFVVFTYSPLVEEDDRLALDASLMPPELIADVTVAQGSDLGR